MNSIKKNIDLIYYLVLLVVLLAIYDQILLDPRYFFIDDSLLLMPLKGIKNFYSEYSKVETLDVQPLRDLTFYLEIRFNSLFKVSLFRIDNLLLFYFSLILLYQFSLRFISKKMAMLLVLILSLHPMFVLSIYWISARKHLLAVLFLLCALNKFYQENEKFKTFDIVVLLLSLFFSFLSQPIHLWAPFWMLGVLIYEYHFFKKKCLAKNISALLGIALASIVGLINVLSYKSKMLPGGVNVGGNYDFEHWSRCVLAISRYFVNALFPFFLKLNYAPEAIVNLAGIIIFSFFIYFYIYKKSYLLPLFVMSLLSLVLVTVHKIGWFVNDTYAIFFTFILWVIFFIQIKNINTKAKKIIVVILFLYGLLLGQKSYERINLIGKPLAFFHQNALVEGNELAYAYYVHYLLTHGREAEGMSIFLKYLDYITSDTTVPITLFRSFASRLYASKQFYPEFKIKILSNKKIWCSSAAMYRSLLLLEHGFYGASYREIRVAAELFHINDPLKIQILSVYYELCRKFGDYKCLDPFYTIYNSFSEQDKNKFEKFYTEVFPRLEYFYHAENVKRISKTFYFYYDENFYDVQVTLAMLDENYCTKDFKNY